MDEKPKIRLLDMFPVEISGEQRIALRDPQDITQNILSVSPQTLHIISLLNGKNTLRDIQAAFMRSFGTLICKETIEELLNLLDEHYLLENQRYFDYCNRLKQEFRQAQVREAQFGGKSYPGKIDELCSFLEDAYKSANVLNEVTSVEGKRLVGFIAPHIDLKVGKECYAKAYNHVNPGDPPALVIILGTAHMGAETPYVITTKNFLTPLGELETDKGFIENLEKKYGANLTDEEYTHKSEHSIEFQVIFIQHRINQKPGREVKLKIIPILCNSFHHLIENQKIPEDDPEIKDFLIALQETIKEYHDNVCVIASGDLAHVGLRFGATEALTKYSLNELARNDMETLQYALKVDRQGFFENIARDSNARNICGLSSIYTMLAVLPRAEGELLQYDQWDDSETGSAVTYASVVYYR